MECRSIPTICWVGLEIGMLQNYFSDSDCATLPCEVKRLIQKVVNFSLLSHFTVPTVLLKNLLRKCFGIGNVLATLGSSEIPLRVYFEHTHNNKKETLDEIMRRIKPSSQRKKKLLSIPPVHLQNRRSMKFRIAWTLQTKASFGKRLRYFLTKQPSVSYAASKLSTVLKEHFEETMDDEAHVNFVSPGSKKYSSKFISISAKAIVLHAHGRYTGGPILMLR